MNDKIIDSLNLEMDIIENPNLDNELNRNYKSLSYQSNTNEKSITLLSAKNLVRPQTFFKYPIDNSHVPFRPNIDGPFADTSELTETDSPDYEHPFEGRIFNLIDSLKDTKITIDKNEFPKNLDDTPLENVDTLDQLLKVITDLTKESIISVDLEHHSFRSFFGITCLIQISTPDKDYIIDALALRHELYRLNQIFANEKIIKVFHGSNSDLLWLQRDFNVYVVNLFDTQVAAKALVLPKKSLAFLLIHYTKVATNKKFQLADWRIRPLTQDMIKYARIDTHYLIYIAKQMLKELFDQGNLLVVQEKSNKMTLIKYMKPQFKPEGFKDLFGISYNSFGIRKHFAAESLYTFRDSIARKEDESAYFVIPDKNLRALIEHMPKEVSQILSICSPCPPLVRKYAFDIQKIFSDAWDKSEDDLIKLSKTTWINQQYEINSNENNIESSKIQSKLVNHIFRPHDKTVYKVSPTDSCRPDYKNYSRPKPCSKLSQIVFTQNNQHLVNYYEDLIQKLEEYTIKAKVKSTSKYPYQAPSNFNETKQSTETSFVDQKKTFTDQVIFLSGTPIRSKTDQSPISTSAVVNQSQPILVESGEEEDDDSVIILNDDISSSASVSASTSGKKAKFSRIKLKTKKKYQDITDDSNSGSLPKSKKSKHANKSHSFGSIQKLFSAFD